MAPRHNPRRNVGAPVRFEDDETYLIERPRDSTKPAFPKLLAESTVPYDHTLPPVSWNTRPLDQPSHLIPARPPIKRQEAASHSRREEEEFSKEIPFETLHDLDMDTSASEGEDSDNDDDYPKSDQTMVSVVPAWSALEPALQLSMYEYVYRFLGTQKENKPSGIHKKDITQAKAAEILGLSDHELFEIERQRAFRTAHSLSEEYLQKQWWKEEQAIMNGEHPLSKDASRYRDQRQATNAKYIALMVHICKYTYTNKRAIKLAKAYLNARGLKPKVVGEWTEGEEETTMALASTQVADLTSPILLPVSCLTETLQDDSMEPLDAVTHPFREVATDTGQTLAALRAHSTLREIRSVEDFARRHDPKPIRRPSALVHERGRSLVRSSDLLMKINSAGKAELRKKPSKRQADSELRPGYPKEYFGAQRIVVLENGSIGMDVDAKPTTEVDSLMLATFEASRRGHGTGLTSRIQDSLSSKSPALKATSRRFSDVLLEIDTDHMSTAPKDQDRKPLLLTSTPPQPDWSPIGGPPRPTSSSPRPVKSTSMILKQMVAKSTSVAPAFKYLSTVSTQRETQSPHVKAKKKRPVQFSFQTIARDIASSQEQQASTVGSQYKRSLSAPPPDPDHLQNDNDSGIGISRATSTELEIANRVMGESAKLPKAQNVAKTPKTSNTPRAKQQQQMSSQKVTNSTRQIGKGSRGGPGSYKKKQKIAEEPAVVGLPLMEKTNVSGSGGTSHAA